MNINSQKPHQRLEWLDITKCLAIILVVAGHLIQGRIQNYDLNPVFKIIYMFHMPVFFYISGMAYDLTKRNNNQKKLLTNFQRLLLPFLTWHLISYAYTATSPIEITSLTEHFKSLYQAPDNGLWFLWILFTYYVIAKICTFIQTSFKINFALSWITITFLLILISTKFNFLGIKLIIKHIPYFVAGLIYNKTANFLHKNNKPLLLTALIGFVLIYFVWARNLRDLSMNLQTLIGVETTSSILFLTISLALTISAGFFGTMILIELSKFLDLVSSKFSKTIMTTIGKNTLEIYVTHTYFLGLYLIPNQPWLDIPIIALIIIGICITMSTLIKNQIQPAAFFLYGHKLSNR